MNNAPGGRLGAAESPGAIESFGRLGAAESPGALIVA
jgi:hypothetical protein